MLDLLLIVWVSVASSMYAVILLDRKNFEREVIVPLGGTKRTYVLTLIAVLLFAPFLLLAATMAAVTKT